MSDFAQQTLRKSDEVLSVFRRNPYVSGFVILFFLAYGGLVAPKLPVQVAVLFDNTWFKIVFLFLLLLVFRQNPTISLLMAVAFVLSMQALSNYRIANLTNNISSAIQSIKPTDSFADVNYIDHASAPVLVNLNPVAPEMPMPAGNAEAIAPLAHVGQEMLANAGADEMPGMKYEGSLPSNQYAEYPNRDFENLDVASTLLRDRQVYLGAQGQQTPIGYTRNEVSDGMRNATIGLPTSQL